MGSSLNFAGAGRGILGGIPWPSGLAFKVYTCIYHFPRLQAPICFQILHVCHDMIWLQLGQMMANAQLSLDGHKI